MHDKEEMKARITEAMTTLHTASKILENLLAMLEPKVPAKAEPKEPTLVEVRSVLADKSRAGHTEQIRVLLEKYGAPRLSEIDPCNYRGLLDEAVCLGATKDELAQALAEKEREGLGTAFGEVFGHHYATGLEDLREEYYPAFLRDIRGLGRG